MIIEYNGEKLWVIGWTEKDEVILSPISLWNEYNVYIHAKYLRELVC